MNKIKIGIAIAIVVVLGFIVLKQVIPDRYEIAEDEVALHIQMNTEEDIGLLVYDYRVDDAEYSGGVSNADRSLMKHNSDIIVKWDKQELKSSSNVVDLSIQFRIVTEYVDPNYENKYPEDITKCIDEPISWKAHFGKEYYITITGDKVKGYKAVLH